MNEYCVVCGRGFEEFRDAHTTGYARRAADNERICFPCAGDELRREIRDARPGERIGGLYLAGRPESDARYKLQDWAGNTIGYGRVWKRRVGFGGERYYFSAIGFAGVEFHGNGPGPGMYVHAKVSQPGTRDIFEPRT